MTTVTLLQRIVHFERAAVSQDDERTDEELINQLTPYELLDRISDALEYADAVLGRVGFNQDWVPKP